ncbi:hypothetical protein SynBIOSU31_02542 [Synechococcus sp. BIOS-U3-1]|nr:hypothetical protein SynBIOSU31_02542 [Synechococcus sp. BIOS-U3-1]|tara:strand:- start:270 stop:662 length:393 start_codon:yes stop_codon:yes gene_type:complete
MMKSIRMTQFLLAALVVTQIPNLISFIEALGRYGSPESALRACNRWAESAGDYSVRRAGLWTSYSQHSVRTCKKEGDQVVGFELPMQGSAEVSDDPGDPQGFNAGEVPQAEDTGKRWRYRRKRWSLVIPF